MEVKALTPLLIASQTVSDGSDGTPDHQVNCIIFIVWLQAKATEPRLHPQPGGEMRLIIGCEHLSSLTRSRCATREHLAISHIRRRTLEYT